MGYQQQLRGCANAAYARRWRQRLETKDRAEAREREAADVDELRSIMQAAVIKLWIGVPFDATLVWFAKQVEARHERNQADTSRVHSGLREAA